MPPSTFSEESLTFLREKRAHYRIRMTQEDFIYMISTGLTGIVIIMIIRAGANHCHLDCSNPYEGVSFIV
jgi:hypothetical protein